MPHQTKIRKSFLLSCYLATSQRYQKVLKFFGEIGVVTTKANDQRKLKI
jgi:hypothetical protein